MNNNNKLREELAEYAHNAWAGWMEYVFSVSPKNPDGTATIPKWAVDGWGRQIATKYNLLSEKEKDSDRREADIMIRIMQDAVPEEREITMNGLIFPTFCKNHTPALAKLSDEDIINDVNLLLGMVDDLQQCITMLAVDNHDLRGHSGTLSLCGNDVCAAAWKMSTEMGEKSV